MCDPCLQSGVEDHQVKQGKHTAGCHPAKKGSVRGVDQLPLRRAKIASGSLLMAAGGSFYVAAGGSF